MSQKNKDSTNSSSLTELIETLENYMRLALNKVVSKTEVNSTEIGDLKKNLKCQVREIEHSRKVIT